MTPTITQEAALLTNEVITLLAVGSGHLDSYEQSEGVRRMKLSFRDGSELWVTMIEQKGKEEN